MISESLSEGTEIVLVSVFIIKPKQLTVVEGDTNFLGLTSKPNCNSVHKNSAHNYINFETLA